MNYNCQYRMCTDETGSKLVCRAHQKMLTKSQSLRIQIIWHSLIREKERVGGKFRCFHCAGLFFEDETCGDHFPYTKSRRPDLKFDVDNGVCSCSTCNDNQSKKRLNSLDRYQEHGIISLFDFQTQNYDKRKQSNE